MGAYFFFALSPAVELGSMWPPAGVHTSSPFTVPLLNTLILLTSGASVTWASSSLSSAMYFSADSALWLSLFSGCRVLFFIFYSCRFLLWILIFHAYWLPWPTRFYWVCPPLVRLKQGYITCSRHTSMLAAVWYWHFVDVVWLVLFVFFFFWGGKKKKKKKKK